MCVNAIDEAVVLSVIIAVNRGLFNKWYYPTRRVLLALYKDIITHYLLNTIAIYLYIYIQVILTC